ncbi:hypothetical protein BJX63DRAFT_440219 [Aspergillus granulosus]|uniref:Uncharacterized protein n=1 Tax=Aspergillus granulosus TaxID=176169 RepID=A0ABR4GW50_9EURO
MAQYAPVKFTRVINLDKHNNQVILRAVLPRNKNKTYKGFLEFFALNINSRIGEQLLPETINNFRRDFEMALARERSFYVPDSIRTTIREYAASILMYCFSSVQTGKVNKSTARRSIAHEKGIENNNTILDATAMAACYKHFTLTIELVNNIPMLVLTYTREFVKELADTPVFRPTAELDYKISTGRARNADIFSKEFAALGYQNKKYSQEARIKQAAHRDPRTFGRSYTYPVCEVNKPATFLNIASRHEHIQNHRSIGMHRNLGL